MDILARTLVCRWRGSYDFALREIPNVIRKTLLTNPLPLALTSYVVSSNLLPMLLGQTGYHSITLSRQIVGSSLTAA